MEIILKKYNFKSINDDSDLTESELDDKIQSVDTIVPVHDVSKESEILDIVNEIEGEGTFEIVYIHHYLNENIVSFGLKIK